MTQVTQGGVLAFDLLHSSSAMTNHSSPVSEWRPILVHSVRTAVAAVVSLLVARLCRISEPFWAPITTIVITQSSLGAALNVSRQRFIGTVFGAVTGAFAAAFVGPDASPVLRVTVLGLCVFVLGIICELPRLGMTAYRFGGVTVLIILLLPMGDTPWRMALHRFLSVSIGIVTALALAELWPEKEPPQP